MREEIDHMRLGRDTFEGIYKKLEKQLTDCKREMGEVIETSTAAYDARCVCIACFKFVVDC